MAHVLVVESGPRLGPILQNWPEGLEIDPSLEVTVAHAPSTAYTVLREKKVDVLIFSGNEPGLDLVGILVVCAARHPDARALVICPWEPPAALCATHGALRFVSPDLDSLFAAIEAALRSSGDALTLEMLACEEAVLIALMSRWSGTLHARTARKAGYVGVHQGTIVDARFAEARGERALVEIIAQPGGCLVAGPFDRATATATMGVSLRSDLSEIRSRIDVRRDLLAQAPDDETEMSATELAALAGSGAVDRDGPSIFDPDELAELEELARDVHIEEAGGRTSAVGPSSSRGANRQPPSVFAVGAAIEAMLEAGFAWVVIVDCAGDEVLGSAGEGYDVAALELSTVELIGALKPVTLLAGEIREMSIAGEVPIRMVGKGTLVAVGAVHEGVTWLSAQGVARASLTTLAGAAEVG